MCVRQYTRPPTAASRAVDANDADRRCSGLSQRCASTSDPLARLEATLGVGADEPEQAHARDRQPVRDDRLGPAQAPRRVRAARKLRGRRDRHRVAATTRPSCAARPRRRATTSSSRSAATAPSTRPPTGWPAPTPPLTCLPGGRANVYCRMLGIPTDVVDATEHLLALADDWRPRARRPRPRERALLHVLRRASASTPASSSASTPTRG